MTNRTTTRGADACTLICVVVLAIMVGGCASEAHRSDISEYLNLEPVISRQDVTEVRTMTEREGRYENRWTEARNAQGDWKYHGRHVVVHLESSRVVEQIDFVWGLAQGPYFLWDEETGKLVGRGYFVDGTRTGLVERFWADGTREFEGYYFRNEPVGLHRSWYRSGRLFCEGGFAINRLLKGGEVGLWRWWHDNGVLSEEGVYNGEGGRSGIWRDWHSNGQLASCGSYEGVPNSCVASRRVGKWEFWHGNGQQAAVGTYSAGKRIGSWDFWDDSGISITRETYKAKYDFGPLRLWAE